MHHRTDLNVFMLAKENQQENLNSMEEKGDEKRIDYLNSTVMEDVSEPRECSVLVALVEKPNLFFDDIFSLRTCIFVKVHNKTIVFLNLCRSIAERSSQKGKEDEEKQCFGTHFCGGSYNTVH